MFKKQLVEFIQSSADFKLVQSHPPLVAEKIRRICVLDSSFNPPHLAHYRLIQEALHHNYSQEKETASERAILLLLSINNADKSSVPVEEYVGRLDMMQLMAEDIRSKFPEVASVSIGLTKHARFVDKSICIEEKFPVKLTFLMGFDTLVRLFNPKYYFPDKLSHSLEEFMKRTDLFCLSRSITAATDEQQLEYVKDIKKGLYDDIPSHWGNNVHVKNNAESIETISSSEIRDLVKRGDGKWEDLVIAPVRDYVKEHRLFE